MKLTPVILSFLMKMVLFLFILLVKEIALLTREIILNFSETDITEKKDIMMIILLRMFTLLNYWIFSEVEWQLKMVDLAISKVVNLPFRSLISRLYISNSRILLIILERNLHITHMIITGKISGSGIK